MDDDAQSYIEFLYQAYLPDLYFGHTDLKEIQFVSRTEKLRFSIVEKQENEGWPGRKLRYRVSFKTVVRSQYVDVINGVKNRLFVKTDDSKIILPHKHKDKILIQSDGKIPDDQNYWFEYFPEELQKFVTTAERTCSDAFLRFLRIIFWTQNIQFPMTSSDLHGVLYWRTKKTGEYHYVPSRGQTGKLNSAGSKDLLWTQTQQEVAKSVWSKRDAVGPLSHEIIREAAELVTLSPRSALVMAFSALEIGVKNFIAVRVPDAEWIIENLPSPPISKIFRRYMPILDKKSTFSADVYNGISNKISKIEEMRNKVAHTGFSIENHDANNVVNEITTFLYFLDYLAGQVWAAEFAPPDVVKILDAQSTRGGRMVVQFRSGPYL